VQHDGYALQFAAKALRADRDLVLAAVRQNGQSLQFAAKALKADRAVVEAATWTTLFALVHAAPGVRQAMLDEGYPKLWADGDSDDDGDGDADDDGDGDAGDAFAANP